MNHLCLYIQCTVHDHRHVDPGQSGMNKRHGEELENEFCICSCKRSACVNHIRISNKHNRIVGAVRCACVRWYRGRWDVISGTRARAELRLHIDIALLCRGPGGLEGRIDRTEAGIIIMLGR